MSRQQSFQKVGESSQSPQKRSSSPMQDDDWSAIDDPTERRKVQNKLAQRRFRERAKEQKEEQERDLENQKRAASAYAGPEPEDINEGRELSGLPWGGVSMKHIMATSKAKEQRSQQSSRETSVFAAAATSGGASSRLGLSLTDEFARRRLAWKSFYAPYHGGGRR